MNQGNSLPSLPLSEWEDTKTTLHLFLQIVGKIRLCLAPKMNHWWHVPFYVSARGLTTSVMPFEDANVEMEFDLIGHRLVIRSSRGDSATVDLAPHSVAQFYDAALSSLAGMGVKATILPKPFDPSRVKSTEPFATDTYHHTYDPTYVTRFWRILLQLDTIFKEFRGRFVGKCSPVHFFWHSFDLAVTRFSGRPAPVAEGADPVTRDAYSHEVISAGFWVGDDNTPEPAFYTYVHPEPPGLANRPLRPATAGWQPQNGSSMALLRYEDFRHSANPRTTLLDFLQSAYEAGAELAKWPRDQLEVHR